MNGFDLDEDKLLKQLREAKDIEIGHLLTQYGTSLKEVKAMTPQLIGALAQRRLTTALPTQPMFFTAAEAAGMGLALQEDWMLKFTPAEGNGGYTSSLITPEKWEITEDDFYISPTGERYTRAELEGALGVGQMPSIEQPEMPGLELEQIFGKVFPEQDIQEVLAYAQAQPEAFLQEILDIGRTAETEALLRAMYEGVSEQWLDELFEPIEFRRTLIDALPAVTPTNIDGMIDYFSEKPEELRYALVYVGRNEDTEKLVQQLYPGITDYQISDYFNPASLVVEAKAAEGGQGVWGTFTAGVGDLVANVGGIFKWCGAEGVGDKIIKFAQYMQVQAEPVPFEPDEFTWKQLFNPQFYATYGVRMLPTLMTLAIPAIGAYSLAGGIAVKVGVGAVGRAIIAGIGGGIMSRPLESALEAGGAYDLARQKGLSHEEANEAADEVFNKNMLLVGVDIAQIAVAFMPAPGGIGIAAKGAIARGLVTTAKIGGKLVFTGLTEGGEEVLQEMFQRMALGEEVDLSDPEMQLVFSLGLIAGIGMGGGADIITRITNRGIQQLTPEQRTQFDKSKAGHIAKGLTEDVATINALDEVIEQHPEVGEAIEEATKEVEKEIASEQAEKIAKKRAGEPNVPIPSEEAPSAETSMPVGGGVGLGVKDVATVFPQDQDLEVELEIPASKAIIDGLIVPNWIRTTLKGIARVPVFKKIHETTLGWRSLVAKTSQLTEDIVGRAAVVYGAIRRMGVDVARIRVGALKHTIPNPVKYFGFNDVGYSEMMAARLLSAYESERASAGTLEHVFTRPEMYNWTNIDAGLVYVTRVNRIIATINKLLEREGVGFATVSERWIHRVVTGRTIEGEVVGVGGKPGRTGARPGAIPSYKKPRTFKTMAEGIEALIQYEPNIEVSISSFIEEAYKEIAGARFTKLVEEFGITPGERLLERYPEVAERAELTKTELADAANFESLVKRAKRGERLPGQTLLAIERRFPELGRRLRALVQQPIAVEKQMRQLLKQNERAIGELKAQLARAKAAKPGVAKVEVTRIAVADIEPHIEAKYGNLPSEAKPSKWEGIGLIEEHTATPENVDNYLSKLKPEKATAEIEAIEAAIGDLQGDLIATYRYESWEDGREYESYIDSLLGVTHKHRATLGLPRTVDLTIEPLTGKPTKITAPEPVVIPDEQKMREAFKLMEYEDRLAFRNTMDSQLQELGQMLGDQEAQLEALAETLKSDRARPFIDIVAKTGEYKGEIAYLTVTQYRLLTGAKWVVQTMEKMGKKVKTKVLIGGKTPNPSIMTPDGKKVRWEYAMDEVAQELGYESDEAFKKAIEAALDMKQHIDDLKVMLSAGEERLGGVKRMLGVLSDVESKPEVVAAEVVEPMPEAMPEAEINQIVADLNLLREEKVWVDTFKTKGASIIHLQTGETATIVDPPQTIYPFASYEERAMHIKWADGTEMVVDSNDFAPSSLQKQIAEITHGKPIPPFPEAEVTPAVTIPEDIRVVINKIRKLDVKQRELQTTADDILSTSPMGQAPPVYHATLDKAIKITQQKAELWDQIRNRVIPGTTKTLWQTAMERRLSVVSFGEEQHLDFFAEDIEGLFTMAAIPKAEEGEIREEAALYQPGEVATGKEYTATVYRGYKVGTEAVDEGLFGKGTYYTTNREYAETYDGQEVMVATLKNPFVIKTQQEADAFWDETTGPARQKALNEGKTVEEANELAAQAARDYLEGQGYDGLIARDIIAPGDEIVVFYPEKSVGTPIPKAAPGMPEAGLQVDMFGYQTPVTPRGKGEIVQISMDDYQKLVETYAEQGLPPPYVRVKPKIEGISELSGDTEFQQEIFSVADEKTAEQRKADFDRLGSEAKALVEARKAPYWQARAERAAKMEIVRQPGIGEGYLPMPFAGGKIYNQDFIDGCNKFFGVEKGNPALKFTSDAAGILRITKAALDFSAHMIQGLPPFGLAHAYLVKNPPIGAKLMGQWYKALAFSTASFFVPSVFYSHMAKNEQAALQRISFGGSSRAIDYFETLKAKHGLGKIAAWTLGKIPLHPFERAEIAFYAAGEMVRNGFWEILSDKAIKQGKAFELARSLDLMTGLAQAEAMGVPLTMRQLESSFMWFAPNYTRACLSLLSDIFRGGYTGAKAKQALGGMMAAGVIYYTGIQLAMALLSGKDMDDALDDVKQGFGIREDPITHEVTWRPLSDFLGVKIGNYTFGVGSFWYGFVRLIGNISEVINEVGDKERIDLVTILKNGAPNRDNPFIYWWYTRASPLTGMFFELATHKDFLGYPIETIGEYAQYLLTRFEPIWMEQGLNWMIPGAARDYEIPEDAARAAIIPFELFGWRSVPESTWVNFYDKDEEYIKQIPRGELDVKQIEAWEAGDLGWAQLTRKQKQDLINRYPEMAELYEEAQNDSRIRQTPEWEAYTDRTDEERAIYYDRIDELTRRLQAGEIDTSTYRDLASEAGMNYGSIIEAIGRDETYAEIFEYFEKKEAEGSKYEFTFDLAYAEYNAQIRFADDPDIYLPNGDYNWDERDRRIDAFIAKHGETLYHGILDYISAAKEEKGLNPVWVRRGQDSEKLSREYWNLPYQPIMDMTREDFEQGNIPAQYYGLWKTYQGLSDEDKEGFPTLFPDLAKDWRGEYRKNNPEADAMLALWGYSGKIQSMEAYNLVKQWGTELGIPLSQMGLGLPSESLMPSYFDYGNLLIEHSAHSPQVKLWRLQNPNFNTWAMENWGWGGTEDYKGIDYYQLQVTNEPFEMEYAAIPSRDTAARQKYLDAHPEFRDNRNRLKAMDYEMAEDLIEQYVEYQGTEFKDYEDDWWLMEHPEFYKAMFDLDIWTEYRDFSKVPTKAVWNLYQTYQGLPTGTPRLDFRARYPDLDAWLVLKFGYTPIKDRGSAGAEPTSWEELEAAERFKETFK